MADMKDWVGKELGLTDWVTIDQESINTFARITDDEQWIHVDPEKSKLYSPYKTPVAHGFMILSYASKFSYETMSIEDVAMGVNYGLDKVRFPNATPVGASVRGRISLLDYEEKPGGARYIMKVVFEQKGQEKPSCVAEFIAMAYTG
ncbi:MAG: acyl dehydratase [Saprospiraceae bacterium]